MYACPHDDCPHDPCPDEVWLSDTEEEPVRGPSFAAVHYPDGRFTIWHASGHVTEGVSQ